MSDNTNRLSDATKTLTEAELREITLLQEIVMNWKEMGSLLKEHEYSAVRGIACYARDRLVDIEAQLRGS